MVHPVLLKVTDAIKARSESTRQRYLDRMERARRKGRARSHLSCSGAAHSFAASSPEEKAVLQGSSGANIAIVTAYNDMLSAHQPFERFPALIKKTAAARGAAAQVAGGVPAMCDGIIQGEIGMDLSLFSRDVIALSTALGLAHNSFDAMLCLGVCDKIVPGMLIGALSFGHLPLIMLPAGPMPSGIAHEVKAKAREEFAQGKISRQQMLQVESQCFHAAGTCTFYGTANSNQMLMEVMGLHLPGAAFVQPQDPLRDQLTKRATERVLELVDGGPGYRPLARIIDERCIVNALVGLLATGGSTNHTIHLVAIARAAGISINWNDFSELSSVVPTLARIYPNGKADINDFQQAGGCGLVIRELLDAGLLHEELLTVQGDSLREYATIPTLAHQGLSWKQAPEASKDLSVIRPSSDPFSADGGLKLLTGRLGRAIIKTSCLKDEHRVVRAPALVFHSQEAVNEAFKRDELNRDFVCVLGFQGPRARGMPELHRLVPILSILQGRGFKVALVTDGRMSGASGKVPCAIHVTPECAAQGALAKVRDGDMISLNSLTGELEIEITDAELRARAQRYCDCTPHEEGMGRELFGIFRQEASGAEEGASSLFQEPAAVLQMPRAVNQ